MPWCVNMSKLCSQCSQNQTVQFSRSNIVSSSHAPKALIYLIFLIVCVQLSSDCMYLNMHLKRQFTKLHLDLPYKPIRKLSLEVQTQIACEVNATTFLVQFHVLFPKKIVQVYKCHILYLSFPFLSYSYSCEYQTVPFKRELATQIICIYINYVK